MVDIPQILNRDMVMKELSFDKDGRWAVPALNRMSVVDPQLPKQKVIIKDDTFRESTNMPGASPTNAQKLTLAKKLEAVGITEIVAGHAGLKDQCDFMRMVKDAGLKMMVHAYVDFGDWKNGIEKAVAAGADAIWMPGALNPSPIFAAKLGSKYGYWSADFDLSAVLNTMDSAIKLAKDHGKLITVGRAPMIPGIFDQALESYVKAGADRICIFDDRGNYTPQTMGHVVKMHRDAVGPDIKLEVHCHNDFGLALANSLEAVRSGADVVDCVLNGYSHRSGNCALEQIVAALEVLYDLRTGADLKQIMSLCELAAEVFGATCRCLGLRLRRRAHQRTAAGRLVCMGNHAGRNHRPKTPCGVDADSTGTARHGGPRRAKNKTHGAAIQRGAIGTGIRPYAHRYGGEKIRH